MPDLFNYNENNLIDYFKLIGQPGFRARQIHHALYQDNITNFDEMTTLPKTLRAHLSDHFIVATPKVKSESISACGTIKWLLSVDETNAVETVYIPDKNRGTLCISSQVGCALACQFCATGLTGLLRNLSTGEIIQQVWFARQKLQALTGKQKPITNVVFMGMGEPLLNEKNVMDSIDILLSDHGFGLSKHRVTVSTSGISPAINRMTDNCEAALAVSLHSAIESTRIKLMPIAKKHKLNDLMKACDRYTHTRKRSITYEYTMINQINDTPEEAQALASLLKHRKAKVNLIPYNPVEGIQLTCSSQSTILAFQRILQSHGIVTTIRKTRGQKIDAACGQLFGKVTERNKTIAANAFKPIDQTTT